MKDRYQSLEQSKIPQLLAECKIDEKGFSCYHFFKNDSLLQCYGIQAIEISKEVFKTSKAIRMDSGIECLTLNRKLLCSLSQVLLQRKCNLQLWCKDLQTKSKDKSNAWVCCAFATPGNISEWEREVGPMNHIQIAPFVAVIVLPYENISMNIALAIGSTSFNVIKVFEFTDSSDYCTLEALLGQYGIAECLLVNSVENKDDEGTTEDSLNTNKKRRFYVLDDDDDSNNILSSCRTLSHILERLGVKLSPCQYSRQLFSSSYSSKRWDSPILNELEYICESTSEEIEDETGGAVLFPKFSSQRHLKRISEMKHGLVAVSHLLKYLNIWGNSSTKGCYTVEAGFVLSS